MHYELSSLLGALVKYQASDLHLKPGRPPILRIHGNLVAAKTDAITGDELVELVLGALSERQQMMLEGARHVDLSLQYSEQGRFRMNAYYERGNLCAAIRRVPTEIPTLSGLALPEAIRKVCELQQGLVLVTGSTGSGKSTTLAALVHELNQTRSLHILTLEDPIEFIHRDHSCTLTQREVGSDVLSFDDGLIAGLRQDPDVIVMGELRDVSTIRSALTAAETGHLVFATLHTMSARNTIERVIDSFPPDAQPHARLQLASTLQAIFCQKLIPTANAENGRVCAMEILFKSPTVEQQILNHQIEKITDTISSSREYYKMQSMNQALIMLVEGGQITQETALKSTLQPDELKMRFAGFTRDEK